MPKTPKIDVITVKLTCHIPVNRDNREAVDAAYATAQGLCVAAEGLGQTTWEKRLNRVPAPAPAPVAAEPVEGNLDPPESKSEAPDDGMDFPDGLDRRPESETAAAE